MAIVALPKYYIDLNKDGIRDGTRCLWQTKEQYLGRVDP